jgi:hypothetical protein
MSANFANVNIGTTAGDGTGDPLRVAFTKLNLNFANIASGQLDSGNVAYTAANANAWISHYTVTTVGQALDQIIARLNAAGI